MQDKQEKTYTKAMLIRDIAERCFLSDTAIEKRSVAGAVDVTTSMYNTLESRIHELLLCTSPKVDVRIKLFDGLSIRGTYIPEITKKNNFTGKMTTYRPHIEAKAVFSDNYKKKLYQ